MEVHDESYVSLSVAHQIGNLSEIFRDRLRSMGEFSCSLTVELNYIFYTEGLEPAAAVGEVNVVTKMKETGAVIGGEGNGTSAKVYSSFSAMRSTSLPCASLRNSPSLFSSFRAFHCLGLCDAVMMMPPHAFSITTAISVVGVVANQP